MSVSTPAWRTRWRCGSTRKPVGLVEMVIIGGPTLRMATLDVRTPDGRHWEPLIREGVFRSRSSLLENDIVLSTGRLLLEDVRTGGQTSGGTLATLQAHYDLQGATVQMWLHEMGLTDWADVLPRWNGVVDSVKTSAGLVELTLMQGRDWNRDVLVRKVNRHDDPQASEEAIGAPVCIYLGRHDGLPMRFGSPASEYTELQHIREHIAGGARVGAAVLVDTGRGGGGSNPKARVLVAAHRVKQIGVGAPLYGTAMFIEGPDGVAHVMDPAPAEIFNDDTQGAGFTIPDNSGTAWYPLHPVDLALVADYADNPRAILDRDDETTFARMDYAGLKRNLRAILPAIANPGAMRNIYSYIIYRGTGTGVRFSLYNNATGGESILHSGSLTPSTTETHQFFDLGGGLGWGSSNLPTEPWDFSRHELRVAFTGGSPGGTMDIIQVGLTIEYLPAQQLMEVTRQLQTVTVPVRPRERAPDPGRVPFLQTTTAETMQLVNVSELRGKFYANVLGLPDAAGDGTYAGDIITLVGAVNASNTAMLFTPHRAYLAGAAMLPLLEPGDVVVNGGGAFTPGVTVSVPDPVGLTVVFTGPSAITSASVTVTIRRCGRVIERPADMAHVVLRRWGGQTALQIEDAPGELGCVSDARALMVTRSGRDMVLALCVSESTTVSTLLAMLCTASAMQVRLCEFTGRWHFLPWVMDPPVTYPNPVTRGDILDIDRGVETEHTRGADVLSGLVVPHGWDHLSQSYVHEVACSADASSAGHLYRNLRLGKRSIVAGVNDRLEWIDQVGVANTFTIAPGDYDDIDLTNALQAATAGIPGLVRALGVVGVVIAGVNSRINFGVGPSIRIVNLPSGVYTMPQLAAQAQTTMNAPTAGADGWQVVYNTNTRRFQFSTNGINGNGRLMFFNGQVNTACGHFGFGIRDDSSQLSTPFVVQSDVPVEAGQVYMACDRRFDVRWRTGTHGLNGTRQCAAEALGYDWRNDNEGRQLADPFGRVHIGIVPRSDLEAVFAAADARHGTKLPRQLDGRAINDTDTALELMDRVGRIGGASRVLPRFASDVLGDLRVGDVFPFGSDMNLLGSYPRGGGGGLWEGRSIRVLETEQHIGTSFHTEVESVDMTT